MAAITKKQVEPISKGLATMQKQLGDMLQQLHNGDPANSDKLEQKKIRFSPEYQAWRIAVLERDEYTCQHCNQKGGQLHCHHLKSFKTYPELRFEVSNGIVLCAKCHERLHLSRYKKPKILQIA